MPNALIGNMGNGVSNNYNRYPINTFQNNYQGFRSVGFPVQTSGPQTNIIWINDVTEVYTYPITNDSHLLFGDSKKNVFYYRIVDKGGSLVQVARLPFTSEVIFPSPTQGEQQTENTKSKESGYVTKEEHEQLTEMVKSVSAKLDELLK